MNEHLAILAFGLGMKYLFNQNIEIMTLWWRARGGMRCKTFTYTAHINASI